MRMKKRTARVTVILGLLSWAMVSSLAGCNAGPEELQADTIGVSSAASSASFTITGFSGSQDTARVSGSCRYDATSESDSGSASYTLRVGDLSSTDRSRLSTAIGNGSAAINIKVKEYLDVVSSGNTAAYTYSYRIVLKKAGLGMFETSVKMFASGAISNSVNTDTDTPDYSNMRYITAKVGGIGVAPLRDDDTFEVSFAATACYTCGGTAVADQAAAYAYLYAVYGKEKVTITGND